MKTDSWAGSIDPPGSDEPARTERGASAIERRATRVNCPVCGAETELADVLATGRCAGSLSGRTDCDATLSVELVVDDDG